MPVSEDRSGPGEERRRLSTGARTGVSIGIMAAVALLLAWVVSLLPPAPAWISVLVQS